MDTETSLDLSGVTFTGFDGADDRITIIGDGDGETFTGSSAKDTIEGNGGDDTFVLLGGQSFAGDSYDGGAGTDDLLLLLTAGDGQSFYDLTGVVLTSLEEIEFFADGNGFVENNKTVSLSASQIGGAGLSSTLLIDGNASSNSRDLIAIATGGAASLDISGWTFQDWGSTAGPNPDEYIAITGDGDAETITGSSESDHIRGNGGGDEIHGGGGDDIIEGGTGGDVLDGGAGTNDTLSYEHSSAAVTVDLTGQIYASPSGGDAQGDTISNFENVTGSAHDDTLLGLNSSGNILHGGGGSDLLHGFGGVNQLFGDAGNDILDISNVPLPGAGSVFDGGADTDTLSALSFNSATIDLRPYTLVNLEILALQFYAGQGDFQINAAQFAANFTGVEAYKYAPPQNATLSIFMDTATSLDLSGVGFFGFDGAGDRITIFGDGDAETISASGVDDLIYGYGGNDIIRGGEGRELYHWRRRRHDLRRRQGGLSVRQQGIRPDRAGDGRRSGRWRARLRPRLVSRISRRCVCGYRGRRRHAQRCRGRHLCEHRARHRLGVFGLNHRQRFRQRAEGRWRCRHNLRQGRP